jgi:hypothetical protein
MPGPFGLFQAENATELQLEAVDKIGMRRAQVLVRDIDARLLDGPGRRPGGAANRVKQGELLHFLECQLPVSPRIGFQL